MSVCCTDGPSASIQRACMCTLGVESRRPRPVSVLSLPQDCSATRAGRVQVDYALLRGGRALPAAIDWRDRGVITPVKNQVSVVRSTGTHWRQHTVYDRIDAAATINFSTQFGAATIRERRLFRSARVQAE